MRPLLSLAAGALAAGTFATALAGAEQNYVLYCMGCHGVDARGVPGKVPPLAGTLALFMRTSAGRDYLLRVPGAANSALSDAELTAVLNWLAVRYPNAETPQVQPFSEAEVAAARRRPLADVLATRREVVRQLAADGPAPAPDY